MPPTLDTPQSTKPQPLPEEELDSNQHGEQDGSNGKHTSNGAVPPDAKQRNTSNENGYTSNNSSPGTSSTKDVGWEEGGAHTNGTTGHAPDANGVGAGEAV